MEKISSQINVKLEEGLMNESEYTAIVVYAFLGSAELIGKLLIGHYHLRFADPDVLEEAEVKALVDSLENDFPNMSATELDFMARSVKNNFNACLGSVEDSSVMISDMTYPDDGIPMIEVMDMILERGLLALVGDGE